MKTAGTTIHKHGTAKRQEGQISSPEPCLRPSRPFVEQAARGLTGPLPDSSWELAGGARLLCSHKLTHRKTKGSTAGQDGTERWVTTDQFWATVIENNHSKLQALALPYRRVPCSETSFSTDLSADGWPRERGRTQPNPGRTAAAGRCNDVGRIVKISIQ